MELQVKECYKKSVEKAAAELCALPGFKFAAVADTHLDNSVSDTAANMLRKTGKKVKSETVMVKTVKISS